MNDLQLAPCRNMIKHVNELEKYILFSKWRRFSGQRDMFSWVYGISEVEIKDFSSRYDSSQEEIKRIVSLTDNEKLKAKLTTEFLNLPKLNYNEFILDSNNSLWKHATIFRPLRKIKKTIKFKNSIKEIKIICERMINYAENINWLDLEKNGL